jgi:phenylpropionate dioxygenase-like ring-hydroxylating dioxygenase large terminal subunit
VTIAVNGFKNPGPDRPKRALAERAMRRSWFPVARSTDLGSPQKATLLGVNLVVFRRAEGQVAVLSSRCPHRGGDLSLGQQHSDDIACPYHGWRFSGDDGHCTYVPSLPDQSRIPRNARIKAYPAVERYGHVWTVLQDPITEMYELPEWKDLGLEWLAAEPLMSPTGVAVAIENFRDVAHFPFVHRATMGDVREVVEPLEVRREGLNVWMDRALPAQEDAWHNDGDQMMRYHCVAPGLAAITFTSDTLGSRVVAGFPSPETYDSVRIFWGVANQRGYRGNALEQNLALEQSVYLEDLPIAAALEPSEVPWDGEYEEFSVPADIFTLNYRRAFRELMGRTEAAERAEPAVTAG